MTSEASSQPWLIRSPYRTVVLVWLLVAIMLVPSELSRLAQMSFNDPDDSLRLLQVRALLDGQSWFDLHQYRINPPEGVLMHWSRLVDIPLVACNLALRPLLGQAGAEQVAVLIVPMLTLLCAMLLIARLCLRLAAPEDRPVAVAAAGLLWPVAFTTMSQFRPLRIDHHGWQIVALLAATNGLIARDARKGGWVIGAAIAVGLTISLELLPYVAIFGAILTFRWLRSNEARVGLVAMLDALALTSLALFAVTHGGTDLVAHCDSYSPPYIAGFLVAALLVRATARLNPDRTLVVLALLGAAGLATVGSFLLLAPQCTTGPFAQLDPLVREFWYNNVPEGLSVWRQPRNVVPQVVVPNLLALFCAAFVIRRTTDERRDRWLDFTALFIGFSLIGVLVTRAGAATGALTITVMACSLLPLVKHIVAMKRPVLRIGALVLLVCAYIPGLLLVAVAGHFPSLDPKITNANSEGTQYRIACGMPVSLLELPPLEGKTIFAPLDIGPVVLQHSPYSVIATGHHRASAAMHDVIAAFLAAPEVAHGIVKRHGASYVLSCADLYEARIYHETAAAGLMARLIENRPPDWLKPVPLPDSAGTLQWCDSNYSMHQPWLAISDWPVSALLSKPAKNSASSAMSSTVVNSPSTVWPSMTFLTTSSSLIPSSLACSGICLSTSGVRTKPGQMTLVRTPFLPPSLAITRARPSNPCLAVT